MSEAGQGMPLAEALDEMWAGWRVAEARWNAERAELVAECDALRAAGDLMQSSVSRLAEHALQSATSAICRPPYEVHMAALEGQSAAQDWTNARAREALGDRGSGQT